MQVGLGRLPVRRRQGWRTSCVASERRERERVTGRGKRGQRRKGKEEEGDWEAEKGQEDEAK